MGCGTKEPKITQLCLAAIQRLMSHEVVSEVRTSSHVSNLLLIHMHSVMRWLIRIIKYLKSNSDGLLSLLSLMLHHIIYDA